MRLEKIQAHLNLRSIPFQYFEDNNCGTIECIHRGLAYHIWEYPDAEGADSNVRSAGRMEAYTGNYEEQTLDVLKTW